MTTDAISVGATVLISMNHVPVHATYIGKSNKYAGYHEVTYQGRKLVRKLLQGSSTETPAQPDPVTQPDQPVVVQQEKKGDAQILSTVVEDDDSFSIDERFGFITDMVEMVATGSAKSLIVTGSGGLGKTYTVMKGLEDLDMDEDVDYVIIKGYSTAKSLYCKLFTSNGKVIVFDDCDSVLEDRTAVNLLKSALDTTRRRTLSWLAGGSDNVPTTFEFTGRIIFISNKPLDKIPQPMLSRAMFVDVTMTTDEKIARMRSIIMKIKPELTHSQKTEVLDIIIRYKNRIHDLNIRTFLKACDIREGGATSWRRLVAYALLTQPVQR